MTKSVMITIRITPELKRMLESQAEHESRSITGYLEWLIKRDARHQRESRKTDAEE